MDRPIKKGRLAKSETGQPVLVNESGEGNTVSGLTAGIWKMLDGTKSAEDLAWAISKQSDINPLEMKMAINGIISELRALGLVE